MTPQLMQRPQAMKGTKVYLLTNGPVRGVFGDPVRAIAHMSGKGYDLWTTGQSGAKVTENDAAAYLSQGTQIQVRLVGGKMCIATLELVELL